MFHGEVPVGGDPHQGHFPFLGHSQACHVRRMEMTFKKKIGCPTNLGPMAIYNNMRTYDMAISSSLRHGYIFVNHVLQLWCSMGISLTWWLLNCTIGPCWTHRLSWGASACAKHMSTARESETRQTAPPCTCVAQIEVPLMSLGVD